MNDEKYKNAVKEKSIEKYIKKRMPRGLRVIVSQSKKKMIPGKQMKIVNKNLEKILHDTMTRSEGAAPATPDEEPCDTMPQSKKKVIQEKQLEMVNKDPEKILCDTVTQSEGAAPGGEQFVKQKQEELYDIMSQSKDRIPATSVYQTTVSREEIIRKCGIRESENTSGVKTREQDAKKLLSEDADERIEEPRVCSVEEREAIKRKKQEKETGKNRSEKKGSNRKQDKSKEKTENMKWALITSHMIRTLMHENGKEDADSHWKLVSSLAKYDVGRALKTITKPIRKLLKKLALWMSLVLLLLILALMPAVMLMYILFSPSMYFTSFYDKIDGIPENSSYIKNVLQEMYTEFSGDIEDFKDDSDDNQVVYEYDKYSEADEVTAVYLAKICSGRDYDTLTDLTVTDGYPPYLLIDTNKEKKVLKEVFKQFNSTKREDIEIEKIDEDGEKYKVHAEKMTIYCLSMDDWKEKYESTLSEKERKMLDKLLENVDGGIAGSIINGGSTSLDDIVVPEGVDEKLLYLAGFLKAEAGNQSEKGKLAVAYVILNRSGGAGGDIKGTLTAPYQFSCYIPYHTVEKYLSEYARMSDEQREHDACWKAAKAAYTGTAGNPIGDRKYYCNPKYCSGGEDAQWKKINVKNSADDIIIIGDHVFCRYCW